jgi:hypothetical protein
MRTDIEKRLLERSQAALSGTLPVDPALERSLTDNTRTLEATLAQQLGPRYATSTAGIQALAENTKRAEELRSSARTGQLSLAEQLGVARQQMGNVERAGNIGRLLQAYGVPSGPAGAGTGQLNALAQALQGYGVQRQGSFQASIFNAQQPRFLSFLGNLLGIGAGAFIGGFGGGAGESLGSRLFGGVPKGTP